MVAGEPTDVAVVEGVEPVRWFLMDNWCEPLSSVKPKSWSGWEARYDNDCEHGKRTCRNLDCETLGIVCFMEAMLGECQKRFGIEELTTDPELHGGGLHVMEPGGWLNTHLDYDRHPMFPEKRRAVNLIAFVHERWESEWGGEFVLTDPMGNVVTSIEPKPGRLIAFETNDLSYHGVSPITGPCERASVAVYLLAPAGAHNTRQRALFIPNRSAR